MPVADLQRVQLSEQQAKMAIARLKKSSLNHPIWQNKLLASSLRGELSLSDYRLLFSQYYFYKILT